MELGFVLTFGGSGRIGFCYLAGVHMRLATIYAEAAGTGKPLMFSPEPMYGEWRDDKFVTSHLKKSAKLIGFSFADLMNHLANHHTPWRFHGFWDGKPCDRNDNSGLWRPLWGRIIESAVRAVSGLPHDVAPQVADKLRRLANESQIVLER